MVIILKVFNENIEILALTPELLELKNEIKR
jgi:hypothetical protein